MYDILTTAGVVITLTAIFILFFLLSFNVMLDYDMPEWLWGLSMFLLMVGFVIALAGAGLKQ